MIGDKLLGKIRVLYCFTEVNHLKCFIMTLGKFFGFLDS